MITSLLWATIAHVLQRYGLQRGTADHDGQLRSFRLFLGFAQHRSNKERRQQAKDQVVDKQVVTRVMESSTLGQVGVNMSESRSRTLL